MRRAPAAALAALAPLCVAGPAVAQEIVSQAECVPAGGEMAYACVFSLADGETGAPVEDAAFTVHATMPSMPMAHNVPPATAEPTGTPGEYAAEVPLEMTGTWRLELRFTAPHAARLDHRIDFVE